MEVYSLLGLVLVTWIPRVNDVVFVALHHTDASKGLPDDTLVWEPSLALMVHSCVLMMCEHDRAALSSPVPLIPLFRSRFEVLGDTMMKQLVALGVTAALDISEGASRALE